jgi:hypothetical protein
MKPEVERCGEEAALYSAIRLNRVKEEDVVVAGRGVEGEVSRARCQGRGVKGEVEGHLGQKLWTANFHTGYRAASLIG